MNEITLHKDAPAPAGRVPRAAGASVGQWLAGGGFVAALLAAYVALVPSVHLLPDLGLYDEKRLLQLVVLGAAALTLLCAPAARDGWLRTVGALPRAARAGLGVVLALGLLSAALAPMPRYAFLEVGHWALLFVLTVSAAQGVRASRSYLVVQRSSPPGQEDTNVVTGEQRSEQIQGGSKIGLASPLSTTPPCRGFAERRDTLRAPLLSRRGTQSAKVSSFARQFPGERTAETAGRLVVGVVVLSAVLYVVTFLVGYAMYLWGSGLLWPEAFNGFSNRRFFNQYQTWTLPFLLAAPLLLKGRPRAVRLALGSLGAVWWALLIASGGRGAALAAGAATLGVGLAFGRAAWPWMRQQGAALAGGAALYVLLFRMLMHTRLSLMERDLARQGGRPQAWSDALEMATQHPLLGAGPMHYAFQPFASIWAHPHQALLQWAAEWGLFSAAVVLALALWGLAAWTRHAQVAVKAEDAAPARAALRVALTAALLGGAAHAMVSGLIVTPLSQLLMVSVVGGAWGLMLPTSEGSSTSLAPQWRHRLLQGALALALCAVAVGVASDAPALKAKEDAYVEAYQPRALWPRYWQQGFIGY